MQQRENYKKVAVLENYFSWDGKERINEDGNSADTSIIASGSTCSKSKCMAPAPVAAQQLKKKQRNMCSRAKGKGKKKGGSSRPRVRRKYKWVMRGTWQI